MEEAIDLGYDNEVVKDADECDEGTLAFECTNIAGSFAGRIRLCTVLDTPDCLLSSILVRFNYE